MSKILKRFFVLHSIKDFVFTIFAVMVVICLTVLALKAKSLEDSSFSTSSDINGISKSIDELRQKTLLTPTSVQTPDTLDQYEIKREPIFNNINELQWEKIVIMGTEFGISYEVPTIMKPTINSNKNIFYSFSGIHTVGAEGAGDSIFFEIWKADNEFFNGNIWGPAEDTGKKSTIGGKESRIFTKHDPGDDLCPGGWEVVKNNYNEELAFHFCVLREMLGSGKENIDSEKEVAKDRVLYDQIIARIRNSIIFINDTVVD